MGITPDTKNWTWVVHRRCPECGFDASVIDARDVARLLRQVAAAWDGVLQRSDTQVRSRADHWSPLEYGCHVRDVCRIYDGRLRRMLTEDNPTYQNWDQDATALDERYREQDPSVVRGELLADADVLAKRFDAVPEDGWARTGTRSDGAHFTIDSFARYFIHDVIHHLYDVDATFDLGSGA